MCVNRGPGPHSGSQRRRWELLAPGWRASSGTSQALPVPRRIPRLGQAAQPALQQGQGAAHTHLCTEHTHTQVQHFTYRSHKTSSLSTALTRDIFTSRKEMMWKSCWLRSWLHTLSIQPELRGVCLCVCAPVVCYCQGRVREVLISCWLCKDCRPRPLPPVSNDSVFFNPLFFIPAAT